MSYLAERVEAAIMDAWGSGAPGSTGHEMALAAIAVVRDVEQWQPIETAPKDVWARSQQIMCGHSEKKWIRFGRYYGELKRWYYSGTNERSQWAETPGDEPTHWMPMIKLPADLGKE